MAENSEPLYAGEFLELLSKTLGLPPLLRHVVIDVEYGKFPIIYIETFADERLLNIDWAGHLKGTEIKIVRASEQKP